MSQSCGQGLVSITSESRTLAKPSQMHHYLELAEIRAAFRRAGLLREWAGDLEVRSINQSIDLPLAKDYDAIADVQWEANTFRIAIEYERSLKVFRSVSRTHLLDCERTSGPAGPLFHLFGRSPYQLKPEFDRQEFPVALMPSHVFRINPLTARLYLTRALGAQRATLPALLRTLSAGRIGGGAVAVPHFSKWDHRTHGRRHSHAVAVCGSACSKCNPFQPKCPQKSP